MATRMRQVRLEGAQLELALSLKRHIDEANAKITELQRQASHRVEFTLAAIASTLGLEDNGSWQLDMQYVEQLGLVLLRGHEEAEDEAELRVFVARATGDAGPPQTTEH
jgi:hypothetical protein